MFPTYKALCEMIEQAMQNKAPEMHRSLKAAGALADEIAQRAKVAEESYLEAVAEEAKSALLTRQTLDPMEQMQQRMAQQRTAAETAVAQALEFPSEGAPEATILLRGNS